MVDINNWVHIFVTAVGALVTALAVSHTTNRADYNAIIKELKAEKNEYRQAYLDAFQRYMSAEKKVSELTEQIDKLKRKLKEH